MILFYVSQTWRYDWKKTKRTVKTSKYGKDRVYEEVVFQIALVTGTGAPPVWKQWRVAGPEASLIKELSESSRQHHRPVFMALKHGKRIVWKPPRKRDSKGNQKPKSILWFPYIP